MKVQDGSSFDLLVVGGGSAGIIAAIAAARCGLKTGLVEQNGYCGGMTVASSIHALDGIMANHDDKELAVAGVASELIDRLNQVGAISADNPPECISVDPEAMKWVADQMLIEAKVELFYHTRLIDVEKAGSMVSAVILHNKSGVWRFAADYFIDATGDGDLCAAAGADSEISHLLQPMTLHFRVQVSNGYKTWKELEMDCAEVVSRAHKEGRVSQFGGPWVIRIRDNEVSLNCTRLYGNGLNVKDLTAAEIAGRSDAWDILDLLRQELPEFKDSYIIASGPTVMVRETRRIMGEYVLTADDIVAGRRFPDAVGLGAWPMDIHPGNGDVGYHPHKEHTPPPYQIPYRCLLPRRLDNVLVTGRCISSTREAHGSIRVQGTAMMMGQAAGLACSVAKATGRPLKEIPYDRLRSELERTGAILDPDKLLVRPVQWQSCLASA